MSEKKQRQQTGGRYTAAYKPQSAKKVRTHGTHVPMPKKRKDRFSKQWVQLMKDYSDNEL